MKVGDVDRVINELADLKYKKGYSRKSMIEYLQKTYNLKVSRCYALIEQMFKRTAEAYKSINDEALLSSIAFMEQLQQTALLNYNAKLAFQIQQEINKLLELTKNEIEIKGSIDTIKIEIVQPKNDDKE